MPVRIPIMGKKKAKAPKTPIGPLLAKNLARLGYADMVVRSKEVADKVSERTGKKISRQRVSALMNAVNVSPETLEMLAKGLGVDPSELTRENGGEE